MAQQNNGPAQGGQSQNADSNTPDNSGTPNQDQDNQDQGGDNQDQAQGGQAQDTNQDQDNQDQGNTPNQDADSDDDADSQDDDSQDTDSKDDDSQDDDDLTDDETDALEAKVKRNLSKVRRENSNLRERLKGETTRADRLQVALDAEVPKDAVKFLTGDTVEELEKSAEDLLVLMGYSGGVTPPGLPVERGGKPHRGNGGVPVSQAANEDNLDAIGSRMYRK